MAERKVDSALIEKVDSVFRPVEPMGKAVEARLRKALRRAAEHLVQNGMREADIDGAMVAYGFRKGPFGGRTKSQSNSDVERRLIAALLVEGAACVDEGAVQRPADIDAIAVHAISFPRRKGGPMRAAQTAGLIGLRKDMRVWAQDSDIWAVPNLLDEAIKDARGFDAVG